MITDFPCWVDVEIARFQKYKKNKKNQNLKKNRKRKGKVEGLVWKPSKTFPINTMLQWKWRRRKTYSGGRKKIDSRGENFRGEGSQKVNPKPKYFSFLFQGRHPFARRKTGRPSLVSPSALFPLCHFRHLSPQNHFQRPPLSPAKAQCPSANKKLKLSFLFQSGRSLPLQKTES